ncbi:PREDICTED: uncharacterized protein LOC109149240 [Ipomoea nil]|uniref:uncharacterized protein LOC109149240 n=1 Tax=Ipomoea nil TaxID=35883 RepID=UPI000901A44D|nr:PREDICTED: uncharacterized protein LOC109149240 [Ipomoea nil]
MTGNNISSSSEDVNKWEREIAPSHYMLRIDSFSKLTKMLLEGRLQYFKSKTFDASGLKWNFLVYPNGDEKSNSTGHISVSVCIEDTAALPKSWAKYADLKFFIHDQVRQKYSVFQVGGASSLHDFHSLKTEWGITKLVSRYVFDDAANGYLVNDKCVFGVEVFLLDSNFAEECLSLCVEVDKTFTWIVTDYNNLGSEVHYSYEFPVASFKWQLLLYPLGNGEFSGTHLSLFLGLVDEKIACSKLLVHCMLCVRNQKSGKHQEKQNCKCFAPGYSSWGWAFSMYPNGVGPNKGHISVFLCIQNTRDKVNKFHYLKQECGISNLVPRCEFDDAANGYLVDDICVFGVEVFVLHSKFVKQPSFKWKVLLYPLGVGSKRPDGLNLGLYLTLVDPGATPNALLVHFMLSIRNQGKYGKHQIVLVFLLLDFLVGAGVRKFVYTAG